MDPKTKVETKEEVIEENDEKLHFVLEVQDSAMGNVAELKTKGEE